MLIGSTEEINRSVKSPYATLYYTTPAAQWQECVPLGNGRLGMMPDGGVEREHVVLNEISMWSGSEADFSNPDAGEALPKIRELLFAGKNVEAQEMMYEKFVTRNDPATYGTFQLLSDLHIDYLYNGDGEVVDYERELDLNRAIAYTSFTRGGVEYTRSYFTPRSKDVMLIHLKASDKRAINLDISLSRPSNEPSTIAADGTLQHSGALESGQTGVEGVKYTTIIDAVVEGSKASKKSKNGVISLRDCDEVWIVVSAATSFFEGDDYLAHAKKLLTQAMTSNLDEVKTEAVEEYQSLFHRATLMINGNDSTSLLPTDKRIELFQSVDDPSLAALYYNYGRYLLISSTREGSLPPNLQGLWANDTYSPWNGDYHLNINVQMNHWPVEQGNLSELHMPLVELTKRLVKNGERSAKCFYGNDAEGWVAHMMTNVWNYAEPGSHPSWGATNTGGAWLCAHLWEHYLFTGDKAYLRDIYPVIKGASEFFISAMVVDPKSGWLVTAPTSSPENSFYVVGSNTPVSICMGSTMDVQLVRELFTNVAEAADILDIDSDYAKELRAACDKFPPHQISDKGYLMEWLEDYREADRQHRHVSHLYGLHPGNQISIANTPELAEACRVVLNRRGDGGTGWSRAWKINFWARLGDGDRAYKLFKSLMVPAYREDDPTQHRSGTFPNLFCSHSPFQMDGNWGGTSGISEMLLQSQDGFINLLPSLPSTWVSGELKGFRVRGGAEVDMVWSDGVVTTATITADRKQTQRIKMPKGVSHVEVYRADDIEIYSGHDILELKLKRGERTEITFCRE